MHRILTHLAATAGAGLFTALLQADFVLTGTDYLEVTSSHTYGLMLDASSAWIHAGGRVDRLDIYDTAVPTIGSGGYVGSLKAYGQSQTVVQDGAAGSVSLYNLSLLQIHGGQISSVYLLEAEAFGPLRLAMQAGRIIYLGVSLRLEDQEQVLWSGRTSDLAPHGVQITGGTVDLIRPSFAAYQNSQLSITGGQSSSVVAYGQSTVNLSGSGAVDAVSLYEQSLLQIHGGQAGSVYLPEVQAFGPLRLKMQAGRIVLLGLTLRLDGDDQVAWSGLGSELASHGLQLTGGSVDAIQASFTTYQNSRLTISGGQNQLIQAYDQSTVHILGGQVNWGVYAHQASTLVISGGLISRISALGESTVDIHAGTVQEISLMGNASTTVTGGQITTASLSDTAHLSLRNGQLSELMAYAQSQTIFYGYNFLASEGLSIEGSLVLGTGLLSGKWADGTAWETHVSAHDPSALIRLAPALLGDTNFDGVVDLADYNNVVNNLGAAGSHVLGDTNLDGVVDLADYNNVVNNLGASAPGMLAVPEPAGLSLVGGVGLITLLWRRYH